MTSKLQLDLEDLQKQLTDLYITVSLAYKRMSKVKDLYSRQIIQSGIDNDIKRANELSDKTEALKKEILKQWNETMSSKVRD
jgi:hypothetical protein